MPVHRKKTKPIGASAPAASQNSGRQTMKNSVTTLISRCRDSRVASAPYSGTIASSSTACAP